MSALPAHSRPSVLCGDKMDLLNVRVWRMENRVSAVTAPESARIAQVQDEIAKRQLLSAFGPTSGQRVRDLSSEALLVECIGLLTAKT